MRFEFKWLQLFAEGGEGGEASGVSPVSPGQDTSTPADKLRDLGVPESKLKRYAKKASTSSEKPNAESAGQVAPATNETEKENSDAHKRKTLDELLKEDPELNKEMQKKMQSRVSKAKKAEDSLGKLAPALEMVARKYGVEASDIDGLIKAIEDDDSYYEDRAMELGTSVELAKKIDRAELITRQAEEAQQKAERDAQLQAHFQKLQESADIFKQDTPNFDLNAELSDPRFVYMTAPNSPVDIDVAYKGLHFDELVNKAVQDAVSKMAASVQSGQRRPQEGASKTANNSVVPNFDYRNMSKEQREAFKKRIRSGEAILPGHEF